MTYPTEPIVARFVFRGRDLGASFASFAEERPACFTFEGAVIATTGEVVTVEASGHRALVDMLEICCSIGPLGCLAHNVERS